MSEPASQPVTHVNQLPPVHQKLRLTCCACGQTARYDVGRVFCDSRNKEESDEKRFCFSNYFRCRHCNSPGPWKVADWFHMLGLTLRAMDKDPSNGLMFGALGMFDGSVFQTPAMGEEYLKQLIAKDPTNSFLQTRLGNLLCNSGQRAAAHQAYTKAVELDAGDIEARYHLFRYAVDDRRWAEALEQARGIAEAVQQGREAKDERLAETIPAEVFDVMEEHCEHFARLAAPDLDAIEDALADAAGIEIVDEPEDEMSEQSKCLFRIEDFVMPLQELVESNGLNANRLSVALPAQEDGRLTTGDRRQIELYDGKKFATWCVETLRELFRGNQQPPSPSEMERYPEAYVSAFYLVEEHVLSICAAEGDRTDQEMEELYSQLRRRPDGKSSGPLHDALWQVAALMLAMQPISQAEFEAVLGQLARSARRWKMGVSSRNYVACLRDTFR